MHTIIASPALILHKQKIFIQNCNYANLSADLHIGEEWLRGLARVEPPVALLYANWTPEKFREIILHASIHLPSNKCVSRQRAKLLPNTNPCIHGNRIKITRRKIIKNMLINKLKNHFKEILT